MNQEIEVPAVRRDIRDCLEALADETLQRRVWLGGEFIEGRYATASDPINNLDLLFGDEENPWDSVGYSLRNEAEAALIRRVMVAVGVALSQVKDPKTATDRELLATPGLRSVVDAAARALEEMSRE